MDTLPLFHSWPICDAAERLGLGEMADLGIAESLFAGDIGRLHMHGIGFWSCDLRDNDRLSWAPAVHRLFGLPEDELVTRPFAASRYGRTSRIAMEGLRAYAIQHCRGFTMDALIHRADNDEARWMRLTAVPVISAGKAVRLCGTKADVTAEYDGPDWKGF